MRDLPNNGLYAYREFDVEVTCTGSSESTHLKATITRDRVLVCAMGQTSCAEFCEGKLDEFLVKIYARIDFELDGKSDQSLRSPLTQALQFSPAG